MKIAPVLRCWAALNQHLHKIQGELLHEVALGHEDNEVVVTFMTAALPYNLLSELRLVGRDSRPANTWLTTSPEGFIELRFTFQ